MKRFLIASLTVLMSMGVLGMAAQAKQASLGDAIADLNGDGVVTLTELTIYNRDQRGPKD